VIGNPQTGPDSLYTVIKFPHLITEGKIAKLVLLQPAFGSPIADRVQSMENGKLFSFAKKHFGDDLSKFLTAPVLTMFSEGLAGLTQPERFSLSERLYYVRTASSLLPLNAIFLVPYQMLRAQCETDGITCTADQRLPGIGTDLTDRETISADHWDLFAASPKADTPPSYRKAFTRALLRTVFER